MVGTVNKSIETVVFTWFSRKVRHVCEGGFRRWTMYLLTLVSPMSMPSLRSSPWMRGAPNRVLAAHLPNQLTDFLRHRRAAALASANFPSPKQSKSLAVPRYDGLRFDDAKSERHSSQTPQNQAHRPIEPIQFRSLHRAL